MGGQSLAAESHGRDFNQELLMRASEAPASSSWKRNQHQRRLCLAMPSSSLPVPTHFTASSGEVREGEGAKDTGLSVAEMVAIYW